MHWVQCWSRQTRSRLLLERWRDCKLQRGAQAGKSASHLCLLLFSNYALFLPSRSNTHPPLPAPHVPRRLAAHYDVEGVADSVLLLLSRYSAPLNVGAPKPRVVFGRDVKACAAVEAMFAIATRCVCV